MRTIPLTLLILACGGGQGTSRLFDDQTYHYEATRALGYAASGGSDVTDVLHAIEQIHEGDERSWHAAWSGIADHARARADRYASDARSRGEALLLASNYRRTAEFLLYPEDPDKIPTWRTSTEEFYAGLEALGITHERRVVPWADDGLDALFVPGQERDEILVVVINGFDSTKEEAWFALGRAAVQRGMSFLSYDGPGQGSAIRERGLHMTPEWAPVNEAVLDEVLAAHPEVEEIVLIGFSLGSVLATRSAARDPRVDLLVQYDIMRDFSEVARREMRDGFAQRVFGEPPELERAQRQLEVAMKRSAELDWAMRHSAWILGTGDDYARALSLYPAFNDVEEAPLVDVPVLLLVGEGDHFVDPEVLEPTEAALSDATVVRYDYASGGDEHCQVGAVHQVQGDVFDWVLGHLSSP